MRAHARPSQTFRALSLLRPGSLFTFSAARYSRGHHIEPHTDRAYTNVRVSFRPAAHARRPRAPAARGFHARLPAIGEPVHAGGAGLIVTICLHLPHPPTPRC